MIAAETDAGLEALHARAFPDDGLGTTPLLPARLVEDGEGRLHAATSQYTPTLDELRLWRNSSAPLGRAASCSVVGSSFELLKSFDGPAIDSSEWVIRVNNAPTDERVREHVGTRTTFYVNTFPNVRRLMKRPQQGEPEQTNARPAAGRPPSIYYCHVGRLSRCWTNVPFDRSGRVSPSFIAELRRQLCTPRGKWPSTGAVAVALALRHCTTTKLFGFGGDSESRGCARYYEGWGQSCANYPQPPPPKVGTCAVYAPNATRRSTECLRMRGYFSEQHVYHAWAGEAAWLARLHVEGRVELGTSSVYVHMAGVRTAAGLADADPSSVSSPSGCAARANASDGAVPQGARRARDWQTARGLLRSPDGQLSAACRRRVDRVRATMRLPPSGAPVRVVLINLSFRSRAYHPGQASNSYIQSVLLRALLGADVAGWALPVDTACESPTPTAPDLKGWRGGHHFRGWHSAAQIEAAADPEAALALKSAGERCSTDKRGKRWREELANGTTDCSRPLTTFEAALREATLTIAHPEGTLHWGCGRLAPRDVSRRFSILHMLDAAKRVHNHTTWVMNSMYHACGSARCGNRPRRGASADACAGLEGDALARYAGRVLGRVDWLAARDDASIDRLRRSGVPRRRIDGPTVDMTALLPHRLTAKLAAHIAAMPHNAALVAWLPPAAVPPPLTAAQPGVVSAAPSRTLLYVGTTKAPPGFKAAMGELVRSVHRRSSRLHVIVYHPRGMHVWGNAFGLEDLETVLAERPGGAARLYSHESLSPTEVRPRCARGGGSRVDVRGVPEPVDPLHSRAPPPP